MTRYPSRVLQPKIAILWLTLLFAAGFFIQNVFSAEPIAAGDQIRIECLLPNGQIAELFRPHEVDPGSAAAIIDNSTVSCPLREGDTTIVVALPKNRGHDRLTFVNENAAACGEFKIAVSDSPLAANSPQWTEVDGIIPFSHKRLFNVSLLGVEIRFVRLTFHVDGASEGLTERPTISFHSSALASAIGSQFVKIHGQRSELYSMLGSSVPSLPGALPNE